MLLTLARYLVHLASATLLDRKQTFSQKPAEVRIDRAGRRPTSPTEALEIAYELVTIGRALSDPAKCEPLPQARCSVSKRDFFERRVFLNFHISYISVISTPVKLRRDSNCRAFYVFDFGLVYGYIKVSLSIIMFI